MSVPHFAPSLRRSSIRAAFGLAVLLLCAAQASLAQTAANPVDPGAVQALRDMGTHLQTLTRFQVSTELTVYDGMTVSLYTPAQNFHSTIAFTGTLGHGASASPAHCRPAPIA